MKRKRQEKPYSRMTTKELAAATADLDVEFVADTFGEPDAAALAQLARARGKRGRPKRGDGARVISVSVEQKLLARTDRLARKLKLSRARLIDRALRKVLDDEAA